ncbi:MazG nucleotide pyrophosphohydrolase domain-containing protein [Flexivirga caeni]|uniref:Uncharacterized protein n=1 Tax=Flexivirga caeni TaxID=2294115 RepID=A0A3M9MCE7_9MICO|nr:MazG nucleotide pyrophosphohydrolase domain-containing protein [Flexivirga caeni]RNI22875.1 hypothetical protein EFY87_08695 [Flexivirga caeni]
MTLDEICQNARQLSVAHGWDQADSAARMLHVVAEAGEVADALTAYQQASADDRASARVALGHEIFDVIWNLCALANATDIDVESAARMKMAINADRTWPSSAAI